MPTACITGTAAVPNGTYERPERDLATDVLRKAVSKAGLSLGDVDGIYMPKPRAWTPQGFFSTFLTHRLGLELKRNLEIYTGGTSSASAFRTAVQDVREGNVNVAVVMAAERASIHDIDEYFEYILELFDREFQTPAGPSIPGVYAQSLQRYCHDFGVDRDDIAEIVVKNRTNGVENPDALFGDTLDTEEVLDSSPISEPLRLYECPAPCDGAAALVVTADHNSDRSESAPVEVVSTGYHHPPSHFFGARGHDLSELPAAKVAMSEALDAAGIGVDALDVFEPYAPFPHIEAILTEELGVFERGEGVAACVRSDTATDGVFPVSPSGGCLGRGHPAMVTPLLNYLAAVRQIRGTAPNQVSNVEYVLTTAEHGHVDGVNATVFRGGV